MEFNRDILKRVLEPTPFKVALKELGAELASFLADHESQLQDAPNQRTKVGYIPLRDGNFLSVSSFLPNENSITRGASRIGVSIDNQLLEIHFSNPEHDLGAVFIEGSILCTFSTFGHVFSKTKDGVVKGDLRDPQLITLFKDLAHALRSRITVQNFQEPAELVTSGENLGTKSFSALARLYREEEVLGLTDAAIATTLTAIDKEVAKLS